MKRKDEDVEKILKRYGISGIRGITPMSQGYANRNYRVDADHGTFLYRICKQNTLEGIRYEIDLLEALRPTGFPAAYMIPDRDGQFLNPSPEGPVLIYEFKQGKTPLLNTLTSHEAGSVLARLNRFPHWKNHTRTNALTLETCRELSKILPQARFSYPDITAYFEDQTQLLEAPLAQDLPRGLIHGDLFPDNTIFDKNRLVAVIDFEEACIDRLLVDVGMGIQGFCFSGGRLDTELMGAFLKGYCRIRPMTDGEWELLPWYIQWAGHSMLSWHLRFHLIHRENPAQLARARELMNRVIQTRNSQNQLTDYLETLHDIISHDPGN